MEDNAWLFSQTIKNSMTCKIRAKPKHKSGDSRIQSLNDLRIMTYSKMVMSPSLK